MERLPTLKHPSCYNNGQLLRLRSVTTMATETITRLIDDLDGSEAQRTMTFAWDGRTYEVDLSKKKRCCL